MVYIYRGNGICIIKKNIFYIDLNGFKRNYVYIVVFGGCKG